MSVNFGYPNLGLEKNSVRFEGLAKVKKIAMEVAQEGWPFEYAIYAAVKVIKKACQLPMVSIDKKSFSVFNPPHFIEASLINEGLEKKVIAANHAMVTAEAIHKVMMQGGPLLLTRFTNRPLDYLADETVVVFDSPYFLGTNSFSTGRLFAIRPLTARVEEIQLLDFLRVCRTRPVAVWVLKRFYF